MVSDAIRNEVIARIHWGESPDEVSDWLRENGLSSMEIRDLLEDALRQRGIEIRKKGIMGVIIGTVITLSSGIWIFWVFTKSGSVNAFEGLAYVFIAFIYGVYRLIAGIHYLISGAKIQGCINSLD